MNRFFLSTLAAAAFATAAAPAAQAQGSYNPFQIGGAAGIAFPLSDLGDLTNTGYNVTLAVGYKPQYMPLAFRAEAAYNQFGFDGGGGNINIPAFTGNVVYTLPGVSFSPYAIGGAGLYRVNIDPDGGGGIGENHFGFNVGGGVKIPLSSSFETFIEARYNRVTVDGGSLSFVPITVGIMW